ncbi:MAG: D-alanyl-D-alanine carboxypeptidase [Legionellaceae bacterium]|nr:D-alanyl-D-alanine carboxypeptidase [Legionellaceae bacterium]
MQRICPCFLQSLFIGIMLFIGSAPLYAQAPSVSPPDNGPPLSIPKPPHVNAKAFILMDAHSNRVLAENNSDTRLAPASLTKMMSLYVISSALKNGQIKLDDQVTISKNAWKTGGSRMFVKEGDRVKVQDLLKGIIVDSGNDACVAMAEYLGGSEEGFTDLMNRQAKLLGMNDSHFTDSTGLPHKDLYTTAHDMAILGKALIQDFPEYYHWYKQKWFTYNGIRQPNRNRLLWRDSDVDGLKTGHTNQAGYCLVASAKKEDMRLIAVLLGAPGEAARADDSQKLLNYGFRFYESHFLYPAGKKITELPIYKGNDVNIPVGLHVDQYITIPTGQYKNLNVNSKVPKYLRAPIKKGQAIGELLISLNDTVIAKETLYALHDVDKGGVIKRSFDSIKLTVKDWFN